MASSLVRKCGWLAESRSTMLTTMPARKAPRMLSSPKRSASAVKAMSSTTAKRTRISAVVSCSRTSTSPRRIDRPARATTTAGGGDQHDEHAEQRPARLPVLPSTTRTAARAARSRRGRRRSRPRSRSDRLAVGLPGVLEHGDDEPERCRRQRDDEQQRGADPAGRVQAQPDGEAEREGDRVARARDAQQPPPQPAQRRSPARTGTAGTPGRSARGLDRQVDLHPAEHRRPEDDAGHDLQHDRRQPQPRREPEGAAGPRRATRQTRAGSRRKRRASSATVSQPVGLEQAQPDLADGGERRDGMPEPVQRDLARRWRWSRNAAIPARPGR